MTTIKIIAIFLVSLCAMAGVFAGVGFTAGYLYETLHGGEMQPAQIPAVSGTITGVKK